MKSKRRDSQIPVLGATHTRQTAHNESARLLAENKRMLLENSRKLDAIIKHLGVPYEPSVGFVKE